MPLNIRSDEVNRLAERQAAAKRLNKTDAVKLALENELRRVDRQEPLWLRLKPLRERIAACSDTGLLADKDFFDDLNGEQ
ncbi:type II toxin-antitoxin system VapB family antitoxin [Pararhizobium antarcticum]|uniref:Transcription factor n=1 Tax=Pararhizobium antarcticum TaxID=1798805 RepID=A0A657LSP7_9HYPH|nr:type II toxin-antitoxin system VapB family antitoxin [Pararhizobium antarcticum]OJF92898.1 transcription factor [Pararhizobium antarcticum]OJF97740.1 transcription factor [Rhizobium sp. 58]